jgi:CheY-like chemotaxis protein
MRACVRLERQVSEQQTYTATRSSRPTLILTAEQQLSRPTATGLEQAMPHRQEDTPSVLIIDDDQESREALAEMLALKGYAVATAANGAEGLGYLRSGQRPSAILLDLMMPFIDGWDFRTEQKRDADLAQIPIIVISAAGRLVDAEHSLRKPVEIDALLAMLRNIIDAPP